MLNFHETTFLHFVFASQFPNNFIILPREKLQKASKGLPRGLKVYPQKERLDLRTYCKLQGSRDMLPQKICQIQGFRNAMSCIFRRPFLHVVNKYEGKCNSQLFLKSKKMTPSRRKLRAKDEMPTLQSGKLYTNNYNVKDLSIILVEW